VRNQDGHILITSSRIQALDERLDVVNYDTWNVVVPEGSFLTRVWYDDVVCTLWAEVLCSGYIYKG
jgi:hypothetical protein